MIKKLINTFLLFALLFVALQSTQEAGATSEMAKSQKGKILLQVEKNGEAWYVSPQDEKRYFMGRPADAFGLMRQLGVGIKTADLKKIKIAASNMTGVDTDGDGLSDMFEDAIGTDKNKIDTDGDGFNDGDELKGSYNPNGNGNLTHDSGFANKQKGKIFLQVEGNGEAWYMNPQDGFRYFMGRPADAFNLMRSLGLGITNSNLEQITASETLTTENNAKKDETIVNEKSADSELAQIINAHQEKLKSFTAAYDLYQKANYEKLADELFVSSSQKYAKNLNDEFFITFAENTLKKLNKLNLNNEYTYASSEEGAILPFEKISDTNVRIGLGVDFISPYEIKNENGTWKIDLTMAKKYYTDTEKIDNMEFDAVGSEVELYLMDKFENALTDYKKNNNRYPKYLNQVLASNPSLKNYIDDFEYASFPENIPTKCHIGIDVMDDENKLANDADFDSLTANYSNGFDGGDPIYDKILE